MATSKNSGKLAIVALVALIGGLAGFGYFTQTAQLSDKDKAAQEAPLTKESVAILSPKPTDVILGDNNAVLTVVEYSSLSCPHCAHFHETVWPTIEKEFVTTGKVKWVMRYFPLNDPAMKASELVECAGQNGQKRENFIKVLFDMQDKWAFDEKDYLKDLKQLASVGGVDSAQFDSCMADKSLETKILTMRQDAEDKLKVTGTPTFFIDGKKFTGDPTVEGFRDALKPGAAPAPAPAAAEAPVPAKAE